MAEFNKFFLNANFFDGKILDDKNKLNNIPKFGDNIIFEYKNNTHNDISNNISYYLSNNTNENEKEKY